ncbi:sugar ABC transporter permease [Erwinia typographi]|uniref:Autoinducer 2 import system permease protein LsrC n=1 Tax=Erwinia typographi TaxID=371042 RepID=A0A0A3Z458_9GAMM|nr:ABC transporter permease [Erwinia typographi]KGT92431.1 sugar ABC transporter permease [Erwinia typographi]
MKFLRSHLVTCLLVALWCLLVAVVLLFQPTMLDPINLTALLQFATVLALVALGQALVVLSGGAGIDLSVGGNVSLSAVVGMMALDAGAPAFLLPAICVLCGLLLGLFNGLLIARLKIWPLIVTLGTFYAWSGLALALTGGAALSGVPRELLPWGRGALAAIPLPFLCCVLPAFILAWGILQFTSWGRWIYAMGFNERSARLVGIPVDRLRLLIYGICGALAGCAGFITLAWLGSGRPNVGVNLELESLTAALLGGMAIFGGRGGAIGVLAATLLLVAIKTSLLQFGINTVWQVGVVGLLLIIVLLADRFSSYRR